ncbi:DUF2515 domain-containing protein [Bacillus massilinigeriensis]|uniref:DUF2515 domain-containing protein n=1 Tax=Bacillus massilionigeriensis TaxID=1805475 RepID=UPI0028FCAF82|nr:DUF2515 domain-containing protein [Bacillus massilionigeriensis]
MELNLTDDPRLTDSEILIITEISRKMQVKNMDNISRTNAYFQFYHLYPEIEWAFLASMVSRNAGWNMCDLEGKWYPKIIDSNRRVKLFLTYERANWLIFQDAYPQLLLYHYSTKRNRPMFHLLKYFRVSSFMEREWMEFWSKRNKMRLLVALIINEQNVIEQPIIKHPFYKNNVFDTFLFSFQDSFHFSAVLLPTCKGELYGASVNGFTSVTKRINLGKRLADILFSPSLYSDFIQFANSTIHTGSRHDYEQYFKNPPKRSTPFLRTTFPVIEHRLGKWNDWSKKRRILRRWKNPKVKHIQPIHLTNWYVQKQKQLRWYIRIKNLLVK